MGANLVFAGTRVKGFGLVGDPVVAAWAVVGVFGAVPVFPDVSVGADGWGWFAFGFPCEVGAVWAGVPCGVCGEELVWCSGHGPSFGLLVFRFLAPLTLRVRGCGAPLVGVTLSTTATGDLPEPASA